DGPGGSGAAAISARQAAGARRRRPIPGISWSFPTGGLADVMINPYHRRANISFRITIRNGCQAMMDLPLKTRRSARLMRLVTLFGIALLVITTLFAAWTSVAGEPRHDTVSMHVDSRGLAGWPAATVLLLVGSLLVIALSYL